MERGTNSHRKNYRAAEASRAVVRAFSGWKVRKKLALLHNLFFIVLSVAVFLSVIPLFSQHQDLALYDFEEGTAAQLGIAEDAQQFLAAHPSGTWHDEQNRLLRTGRTPGIYRRVSLSPAFYQSALHHARVILFIVLGTLYVLTIIVMEFIIMPQYVYRPLRLMLDADEATQHGDREHELIEDCYISRDEIGQIMRSRNATVAQLREQEDNLANALRKLEEQDRLVSLGLLSTSVAHELNTPLAVLQGSIEKLRESSTDAHTLDRLDRMLRVTQRLRKISEGLVDFARVRKQDTEAIALRGLIEESWNLVAIDEKASAVRFMNEVRAADTVVGNADRLVQVFVNLLRNGLQAVAAGGTVQVESKAVQRAGQSWIACAVLDNGPGIPADVLPNLFEAFVTTRLDASGTGLGLTVAEGIISQHGGTITAFNRSEGGACLEVLLPAAKANDTLGDGNRVKGISA